MRTGASGRRPFRFGVQLFAARDPATWVERARRAEGLGYSVVSMPDHVKEQLAPIPALAAIAVTTEHIRLGTMVLSNDWRNPVLLAREVATLDWLSRGRLELGIGAGWEARDYEQLGVRYEEPDVRIARLEEALALMRALLAGGRVDFAGRYYQVKGATCFPPAAQTPAPPIAIGGGSRRILELAGRVADIVNVHTNLGAGQRGDDARPALGLAALERRLRWLRASARERSGEIELGLRILIHAVTDSARSVPERAASRWGLSAKEALASPYALIGTVDDIIEQIQARREHWGFTYFVWNEPELELMAPVVARLAGT